MFHKCYFKFFNYSNILKISYFLFYLKQIRKSNLDINKKNLQANLMRGSGTLSTQTTILNLKNKLGSLYFIINAFTRILCFLFKK